MDQQQQNENRMLPNSDSPDRQQPTEQVRVEDLTMEKKLEVLKKYNPVDFYEEGRFIDAQDSVNSWCLGEIVSVEQRNLSIHFDGWSNRWDVFYKANSFKVGPFRKMSRGYTGQSKVALRKQVFTMGNHQAEKEKLTKLMESDLNGLGAFMTTQYLRGSLYVYVDFLLGSTFASEEEVDSVNDFLYTVLKFIGQWLKKVLVLMPLFSQVKINSDLFLIDENIALIQSYPEIFDILRKIMGGCSRCIHYYVFYDKNPQEFQGSVTQPFQDMDFQAQRKKDEEEFDVEQMKENISNYKDILYGQLANFVNYFAQIGGFDGIMDILLFENDQDDKLPLEIISQLVTPFRNCNQIFSPTFSKIFVDKVKDIVLKRITGMSEKELKELDKEVIGRSLNDLKDFLSLSLTNQETAQLIEETQLFVALRFLKSTYLEKRLKGLNDIKTIIDRIEAGEKLQLLANQQNPQNFTRLNNKGLGVAEMRIGGGFKLKPPKWLTGNYLKDWILQQKVLETVLGENTHIEIVKRSGCLLKFLAKQGALPTETIELIWKCQLGKHEEMVRMVYNTIKEIIAFIPLDYIDLFQQKIITMPSSQYDEKFLVFLKDFTLKALENYYEIKSNDMGISENQSVDYEESLLKRETQLISNFKDSLESSSKGLLGDEKLYGLPIFWELLQDKMGTSTNLELMEKAISSMTDIFKQPFSRHIKLTYLVRAIENLLKGESITQSIIIANSIISEYQEVQYDDGSLTISYIITNLDQQIKLIDMIINNIISYQAGVKERVKQIVEKKKVLPEDVTDYIFIGRHSHQVTLNKMLDFLEFLIIKSEQQVTLGTGNIDILWRIFVNQPNFNSDQTLFLKWINKPREIGFQKNEVYLFTDEEKKYFFTKILCNPTYVDFQKISFGQVKCFHKYFKVINRQEEVIEIIRKRMFVVDYKSLIGLDTLWSIATESDNERSREDSMDLLVDLHLKLDARLSIENQKQIWDDFIQRCMLNLDSQNQNLIANTITLLSKFLDRYEGKKILKPEMRLSQHLLQMQLHPLNITVFNKTDQSRQMVQVSLFQTLGFLRQKIADAFGFQMNEFVMSIKNSYVDPDEEDDKYIKDVGAIQQVLIQKNTQYLPENHPKFLVANNQLYFDKLFYLLSTENINLVEPVWELLMKLPVNIKLQHDIKELSGFVENKSNWNKILDPQSTHKLLYCLNIIQDIFKNKNDPKYEQWRFKFQQLGGFQHLLDTFISLDVKQIETSLTLKCIDHLVIILLDFLQSEKQLVQSVMDKKEAFMLKCINLVDLVSDFTIQQEIKRGESYEDINKRLVQNKQTKNKYKSYLAVKGPQDKNQNQNAGAAGQQDDDDDTESNENNLIQQIQKKFADEFIIVQNLFRFMTFCVLLNDPNAVSLLLNYNNLEQMLQKAMLRSENFILREEVSKRIIEMISSKASTPQMKNILPIISMLLFDIQPQIVNYNQRCTNFLNAVSLLLEALHQSDIIELEPKISLLIQALSNQILQCEIIEKNTQDVDQLLIGRMKLLKVLLQKFPHYKEPVGQQLTYHLLHGCLFEVPQGGSTKTSNSGADSPKCKSLLSRTQAMKLLAVLSRDCLQNLTVVLQYMMKFNENPSWRTNKDNDWNISLMESEKSSTGYVGIKNLGCICYMNSLFQQLFMIPGLRNNILSVRDSNAEQVQQEENMLYQLQVLFTGLLKSEKQSVNPKGFCHSFKDWEGQPTNVLEQMDVEEFFNMFMDRLETAMKGTPQEKTIQEHFGGLYANEMICKGCPHTYERPEPFLSIGVPVKNKKSVQEGLEASIQGEMLEGENAYYCEKCDKKVDTLKRTCIKKLPRYLMMGMKRFEFDFDKMIRVKVNDYCEFPLELNMEPYTQEGLARREKAAKLKEEKGDDGGDQANFLDPLKYPQEYYDYKLTGIVVHSGTADSGHYYSFIADREHSESGKWYEMNDHIVREFDPADIPQECYGGEDTFQGYNMMQIKSMKWRNAYLLFYERKTPIDINSDDEEEAQKLKSIAKTKVENSTTNQNDDVQMQTSSTKLLTPVSNHQSKDDTLQLNIPPQIEEKIAYENQKYWQNRFLFGNEYNDFVYDISLNWNTAVIVPKCYLTKNDDFHITNAAKPIEYEKDDQLAVPTDEPLPLQNFYTPIQIAECELNVFKFAAGFYITVLQRAMNRGFIPQMLNLLKAYINKNQQCAEWLISEFCNEEIIRETLLECAQKEMRKFITGLLYCSMLKIYPTEKDRINNYWKIQPLGSKPESFSILGNLILIFVKNLYELKKYVVYFSQYFQVLARFASLGPEAREFLLRARIVGRLMDFFFDDLSPYKDVFRNTDDIVVQLKEKPDMCLPPVNDKKQLSYMQEMLARRRSKMMMEASPKYKYLFETLSKCIRAGKFLTGANSQQVQLMRTPFQLDELNFAGVQKEETDLYFPEAKHLKCIFMEAKKSRAIINLCQGYCHFAWHNAQNFQELVKTMVQGLNDQDFDDVKPFLILCQFLITKATSGESQTQKLDFLLTQFLETVKQNAGYYKFMETMFDFIFKITSRYQLVRQWFYARQPTWEWLLQWAKEYKQPPSAISQNSNIRLFKKRSNLNQMQIHNNQYKYDSVRAQVMNQYRLKRLIQMLEQKVPDLSGEIDIDTIDMQDYKFRLGDQADYYVKKQDRLSTIQVELVLDEMVYVKQQQLSGQNEGHINQNWLSCDTDRLLPFMSYKNQYRNQLIETLTVKLENQRLESSSGSAIQGSNSNNNNSRQVHGGSNSISGSNNMNGVDDDMDTGLINTGVNDGSYHHSQQSENDDEESNQSDEEEPLN